MFTALSSFCLFLFLSQVAEPGKLIWEMGRKDRDSSEFALGPGSWQLFTWNFELAPIFVIGHSDLKEDWPYAHPGPADAWAGSRKHAFSIFFGLKEVPPAGTCKLLVSLVDTHDRLPPKFRIQVNGQAFEHQTPKGGSDQALYGKPSEGKEHHFEIPFPAEILQAGKNEITITNVEGSWVVYDWLGFEAPQGAEVDLLEETQLRAVESPSVLIRRNGKLFQVIRISLLHMGEETTATVAVSGVDSLTQQIRNGRNVIEVERPAVETTTPVLVKVKIRGKTIEEQEKILEPVRKWEIHFLPHSHVDIGYTHLQTEVEAKQCRYIDEAIDLAQRTAEYPSGAQFKWNAEVMWAVDGYMKQATPEKRQRFLDAVKRGWIGLDALYGNELTGLCRPEELFELVGFARRFSKQYSLAIDSAMISDVPGYTWGLVPALAHSGVKYFSIGPNPGHRIGSTSRAWGDKPFYWISPSGKHRVLCWMAGKGYGWFHGWQLGRITKTSLPSIQGYLEELAESGYPYDMVQLRYSIGGDNGPPDPDLPEFVKDWNSRYAYPKMAIATTGELLREFEARYKDKIPVAQGDFTPYWEDGAASSARETGINRASAERLVQAEALWAMLDPKNFPAEDFHKAWREVVLYDEHTWGAHNSISQPEVDFVKGQWKIKQAFALDGDRLSRGLLRRAVKKFPAPQGIVSSVFVLNTCAWPRTDLVVLPLKWNLPGDRVNGPGGKPVPSQRLSTGELTFLAGDIPPLGVKKFTFHAGSAHAAGTSKIDETGISNGMLTLSVREDTGSIKSLTRKGMEPDWVCSTNGQGLNGYFYVAGRDPKTAQRNGPVKIRIREKGPLVSSLLIESDAPGCRALTREVRLVTGLDRVDISTIIDKEKIYEKEGVHLSFPFDVPQGVMRMDVAWGIVQPEKDQLPGACKNYFTVQRWIDISNTEFGVTWATLDAPLVEVGAITTDPIVFGWIEKIESSTAFYSYVMNNYWETNYKAGQEGLTTFRYSVRLHGKFRAAEAQRFGVERSQPLIAVPVREDAQPIPSLLRAEPESVLVTRVKPSGDGKGLMVRLFNTGEKGVQARLIRGDSGPGPVFLSSPAEEEGDRVEGTIRLAPLEIITLRTSLPHQSPDGKARK